MYFLQEGGSGLLGYWGTHLVGEGLAENEGLTQVIFGQFIPEACPTFFDQRCYKTPHHAMYGRLDGGAGDSLELCLISLKARFLQREFG
jgi:hypothetical protein